jgi:hypothetical protein
MTLLPNTLTFQFARAVSWTNDQQVPQTMEVSVTPLANPSFPDQGTFVGGVQSQTVLLTDETNNITFNLIPSYAAGLSEPVLYVAEWREGGITGRTYTQQFAMPAQNVTWDQLNLLGDYISGTNYVQQDQVGAASGVAALNSAGEVVDATGTPVAAQSDLAAINAAVASEVTNRQSAIDALQSTFSTSLAEDVNGLATTVAANLASNVATINATIVSNYDTLNNAITAEATTRAAADVTFTNEITSLTTTVGTINTALATKASLTDGVLSFGEIPPYLLLNAYPVSNQAGMLALSNTAANGGLPPVHYADIAIWANGAVYMLLGNPASPTLDPDPSQVGNWQLLSAVYEVNGKQGNVTLTATDVGAVGNAGSSGTVTMGQVTGLSGALATYAPLASLNTLSTTVTGILDNTNYVQLDTSGPSEGYINSAKLDTGVAYVNNLGEVTLKNGTVIASGTGTILSVNGYETPNVTLTAADVGAVPVGGNVPESAVTGLLADLAARVLSTDSRLTNARTPTAHASTHELSGSDALVLDPSQITGLSSSLAALAPLTTTAAQAAQISSLQSSVTFLLGGGSPSSSPIKAVWFDGPSTFTGITNPADFQNVYNVQQKSPFGQSATDGTYYYNPAGANANEWVYPTITPGGHLKLVKWNESNAADTVYATQAALNSTNSTIATLATAASVANLQNQVNASASQASVNAINTTIQGLATTTQFNALATQVGNAATQAQLNATNATVATLATASSVASLSSAITGLASQSALNTLSATVVAHTNTLALKADLSGPGGTVPLSEMPQNIPIGYIASLQTTLNGLAPLDGGGHVPLSNLPALPISQTTGLQTALNGLCPLVGGQIPSQYLPSLSVNEVFVVANRAQMLAESSAAVGDFCVITGTADEGTYVLTSTPASTFTNWTLLPLGATVTAINGQTGSVNLTAANVGAFATTSQLPLSSVYDLTTNPPTALTTTLQLLATTASVNTALASTTGYGTGLQSQSQVQGAISGSTPVKQLANYVATVSLSLAGTQNIDGVSSVPVNSVVLATAQSDNRDNGLWVVQNGSWTRTSDFATGGYFVRGTLVFVQSGATQANTIWQETSTSGTVGSSALNSGSNSTWSKIMTAGGPISYTNGNGIALNTTTNTFSLNPVAGGGLLSTSAGAAIDPSVVVRKFSATCSTASGALFTAGSTVCQITHGLGTQDLGSVYIREMSTGNQVLACPTVTGPSTCTIEFASAPVTGQWRVTILA